MSSAFSRRRMVQKRGVGCSGVGVWEDSGTASREAESEIEIVFAFALGVGRRRVIPLIDESRGVEWRELGCGQGVCEFSEGQY